MFRISGLDDRGVELFSTLTGSAPREVAASLDALANRHLESSRLWLGMWEAGRPPVNGEELEGLLGRRVDLWHGGLRLGTEAQPSLLAFVRPSWMLGADADPSLESTSWRVSPRSWLVRSAVFRKLGGFWRGFESLEAMVLDLGLRALEGGAVVRYSPLLAPHESTPPVRLPDADEVRLIVRASGRRWACWALWRAWRRRHWSFRACLKGLAGLTVNRPGPTSPLFPSTPAADRPTSGPPPQVTVLIPTLDRYPYLETLLEQLGRQTVPPHQVIVVDQTPKERRRSDLPARFGGLPLLWITLDRAGQCSSRNSGLAQATGEWVLFLDDDVEVPPDFIARHLTIASAYHADASCGTVVEPPFYRRPGQLFFPVVSSVFPTCTALLRRTALAKSGGFDLAYDHGQRADGDLGMRLYLSGALMILDPENCILHHHAPRGGLRAHGARVVRRTDARRGVWPRVRLTAWDLYSAHRYFGPGAVEELLKIAALTTASCDGPWPVKVVRAVLTVLLWPTLKRRLEQIRRDAQRLVALGSSIPLVTPPKPVLPSS